MPETGNMARRRFFVPEIRRGAAALTGSDAEHLVRVLRAQRGQLYEISDNRDAYLAEVVTAAKSLVSFRVIERIPAPAPEPEITLLCALIKFDRFEWLIEKATELGVAAIQPFEAVRSERGLAQAAAKRLPRWEKIAIEASQQSRRLHLPRIERPLKFSEALDARHPVKLFLDENDAPPILVAIPQERRATDRIALLIGPEGGWSEEERPQAITAGWSACSLGRTILRAETAAIAALAIARAAWSA
jgi:16S rRNA (uracil1498-N3)-methyltransferase